MYQEIKVDYLNEVKEEPLDDGNFSLKVPKLEEVDTFEPSAATSVENASELENVEQQREEIYYESAEEISFDTIERELGGMEPHSSTFNKRRGEFEDEYPFEVKMEPVDYSSFDLPSTPILPPMTQYQEEVSQEPRGKSFARECALCGAHHMLKSVTLVEDRLVLKIAMNLCGKYPIYQPYLHPNIPYREMVCLEHFTEAIQEIFGFLNIKTVREIQSCSEETLGCLKIFVNSVCPKLSIRGFSYVLNGFACRIGMGTTDSLEMEAEYADVKAELNDCFAEAFYDIMREGRKRPKHHSRDKCAFCQRTQEKKRLKRSQSDPQKFVLMVGCYLRGDCSLEFARSFLSDSRKSKLICFSHFSEATQQIYDTLQIRSHEEFNNCPPDLKNSFMETVHLISPVCSTSAFRKLLKDFVRIR